MSAIETALNELSANLRRIEQRHQAVGYKFDHLYDLIDEARKELSAAAVNVWQQTIDKELVSSHLGVAGDTATADDAKLALNELICWHIEVATNPATNGGKVLAQATGGQAQDVGRGEVLVTVSGFTGSGKSAIAGEIEILCRALGLQVEWPGGDSEKNMTHADWTAALEQYKPRVRIVECNVPASESKNDN